MKRLLTPLAAIGLLMLPAGCYSPVSRSAATGASVSRWGYGDTIRYRLEGIDSLTPADLKVWVRNNNSYPYNNLWLEVSYTTTDDKLHRDTVNMSLADIYGRWTGNGFGPSYQTETLVASGITLPRRAKVNVRHIMRIDTVTGLEQLGITFE